MRLRLGNLSSNPQNKTKRTTTALRTYKKMPLLGSSSRRNAAHPSFESLDAFFCDCLERVEAAYATLDKACKVVFAVNDVVVPVYLV